MIGYIAGKVIDKSTDCLVVKTDGIGYEIFVPEEILASASEGAFINLYTHLYVREDTMNLYGFSDRESRELFRSLISVSGVGPKTALDVLSSASVTEIKEAVSKAQADLFSAVSGIGKKTARRIIIDLQSKLGQAAELDLTEEPEKEEALQALVNLGYRKKEAVRALRGIDTNLPPEKQLKEALRNLSR